MAKKKLAVLLTSFADNVLSVGRTSGALLIGNSILVKYQIIGANADYLVIALFGVLFGLVGSLSVQQVSDFFKKESS